MVLVTALWLVLLAPQATPPGPPAQTTTAQTPLQPSPTAPLSAAPSDTTVIRKIGGGVAPPKVISTVEPEFTKEARKNKMVGMTLVNLIVDANGMPQNVHVARSMADTVDKKHRKAALSLDDKALEAVKQYRFSPATENGKPVAVELNVEVNFRIF